MDDQPKGREPIDPLDERVKATFAAERGDIEHRRLANPSPVKKRRSVSWIPFAAAAAVIAIAGFFFINNRTNQEAVDLDTAAESDQQGAEEPTPTDVEQDDDQDVAGANEAEPAEDPTEAIEAAGQPGEIPHQRGKNFCTDFDASRNVTYTAGGGPVDLAVVPVVGEPARLSRRLPSGLTVNLTGGCTSGGTGQVNATWVEIDIDSVSSDWIRSEQLVSSDDYSRLTGATPPGATQGGTGPAANECGLSISSPIRFVWGIGLDDPDGGLVAHTQPGIDEPVTRVVPMNGVVFLSGGCVLSASGTAWYELLGLEGFEWVSGNFLSMPEPACLFGEAYGSPSPDEEGDAQTFGPIEGLAIELGDAIAFTDLSSDSYRFYGQTSVRIGVPCYLEGPTGSICIAGGHVLFDLLSPEPLATGSDQLTAERTGRTFAPIERRGLADPYIEIRYTDGDESRIAFFDPTQTPFSQGSCGGSDEPPDGEADSLVGRPCAIDDDTPLESAGRAGSAASQADHLHNVTLQQDDQCTRIVLVLGTGAFTPDDEPAMLVPEIEVDKTENATRISFPNCTPTSPCSPFSDEGAPGRVDFANGTVFIGISADAQPYIQLLYDRGQTSVTLLESPARIVLDWEALPRSIGDGPVVLSNVILAERIDVPIMGNTMAQPTARVIRGWARPFEALGEWVVVPITPDGAIGSTATAVAGGPMPTTGWVDGWGEFVVTLPDLDEGDYAVLFGEVPPGGTSNFVGSGQRIRVTRNGEGAAASYETFITSIEIPTDQE